MIAKFADHLPLYRQESIFGRAGLAIPRSTLAQWVGVTGVQLQPLVDALREVVLGQQVSTPMKHRCKCSCREQRKPTVPMFGPTPPASSRMWQRWFTTSAPAAPESMLATSCKDWKGKLVCDDFGGYKASFELGVTEIGCMAHARRKFFELHATNKSTLAEQALRYIQLLYEIESEVRDLEPDLRRRIRQEKAVPVMDMLHAWMIAQRDLVPEGRPSAEHSITA
jgi:hypothetical protein